MGMSKVQDCLVDTVGVLMVTLRDSCTHPSASHSCSMDPQARIVVREISFTRLGSKGKIQRHKITK